MEKNRETSGWWESLLSYWLFHAAHTVISSCNYRPEKWDLNCPCKGRSDFFLSLSLFVLLPVSQYGNGRLDIWLDKIVG